MKKVISLLLTAVMALSSLTVAFAAEVPTVKFESVDASTVADGGEIVIPVTIDKFPDGRLYMVEINFGFDTSKLEFTGVTRAMKLWDAEYDELANARWSAEAEPINRDGGGSIVFMDSTKGDASFTTESLANNNTLVKLKFKKLAGATGTTEISINNIYLYDNAVNSEGSTYTYSDGQVLGVPSTITLSSGPKDKVETVGTTYTGDLGEVVDGDTTDVATAIYAELNGDTDTTYKKVNWTVNATIDEKAVVGTYTSDVNLSGEATYYLGMVIQGLAQDTVTAVAAALAE